MVVKRQQLFPLFLPMFELQIVYNRQFFVSKQSLLKVVYKLQGTGTLPFAVVFAMQEFARLLYFDIPICDQSNKDIIKLLKIDSWIFSRFNDVTIGTLKYETFFFFIM